MKQKYYLGKIWSWRIGFCLAIAAILGILVLVTAAGNCYLISGNAYDYFTGQPINNGTVTAIVKETGENVSTSFSGGSYSFCLYSKIDASKNSFTVGLIVNSTDHKVGWNTLVIGGGPLTPQNQTCSVRQIHFAGGAISASGPISQGTVGVSVDTEKGLTTNSTSFTNGIWDIYISPCLVSGGLYTFYFNLAGDGKSTTLVIQQVAR